jgi:hypothetical protein
MKYIRNKTRCKLVLTGDDDIFGSNRNSTYNTTGSTYKNGKTIIFNFKSSFNDIVLSHNARCIIEACYIPAITGITNYIMVRLVTPTNDKALDTKKFNRGNPVLAVFNGTEHF